MHIKKTETEHRDAGMIIQKYRLILVQTRWNHFIVIILRLVLPSSFSSAVFFVVYICSPA